VTCFSVKVLEVIRLPLDLSCIDVMDFLDCLDIRNATKATEKEIRFSCPLNAHSGGDDTPSAYMNIHTTAFFCHSCHARGNAVTLAASILDVSPIQATRMLKQRYLPGGIDPDSRNMEEEIRNLIAARGSKEKRTNKRVPDALLEAYKYDWKRAWEDATEPANYLIDQRGFKVSQLNHWGFGYHAEKNRVTLPIRDGEGFIVGIKARAICDNVKPKYLNLRDDDNGLEAFLKNEIVFGLDVVLEGDSDGFRDTLILVEGEYNTIAMHEFHGFRNTVAINGSYFGETQMKLIKRHAEKVILFFDTDQAGIDATIAVSDALRPFVDVWIAPDHHGDPMVMHPYAVRRCINEARSLRRLQLA
jgi:DNA primase